jgi:hypothetical protein
MQMMSNCQIPRQITFVAIYSLNGVKAHREIVAYHVKDAQNRLEALFPSHNIVIIDISKK